jgi:hypothetical protein
MSGKNFQDGFGIYCKKAGPVSGRTTSVPVVSIHVTFFRQD